MRRKRQSLGLAEDLAEMMITGRDLVQVRELGL
jgi:hypothetical protein